MTKRFARIAVVAAAAASFALPASSANASCNWTFVQECVKDLVSSSTVPADEICIPYGTFQICPLPVNA